MAKIKKIIENGGIQYPATITDAVKNPNNGKTVTEELSELGSEVGDIQCIIGNEYDYEKEEGRHDFRIIGTVGSKITITNNTSTVIGAIRCYNGDIQVLEPISEIKPLSSNTAVITEAFDRISLYLNSSGAFKIKIEGLTEKIDKNAKDINTTKEEVKNNSDSINKFMESLVANTINTIVEPNSILKNKLIPQNGIVTDYDTEGLYNVLQYDIADYSGFLYVDAVANYKNQFWVIHDESGNILSKSITYEDNDKHYLVDDKVEIPKNAKYLYVQTFVKDNVAKVVQKEAVYFSPKLWKGIKWGVLGDSLTAINSRTTKHYFDYISELTGIEVVNLAVSGSSYGQPQESGNAFFQQASRLPSDVDVVTIFGSFNSWGVDDNGTIDDTEPTTRYGCINKAIETIYSINPLARVGIVSPTPWGNNGYNPFISDNGNDWGQRTVDRIKDVCYKRGIPFLDLYHTSELRPWDLEYRRLVYSKEDDPETQGVHPNELGHKILSTHFKSFLDKLILSL